MAKKQMKKPAAPIDDPPNASSSSEDEDALPSNKKNTQQQQQEEDDDESSSEEEQEGEDDDTEEEDDEEEEEQVKKTPSKNPKSTTSSETDSDSDSPSASAFKIKPLASKPMDQSTPLSKPSKRSADSNGHVNDTKRAKKNNKGKDSSASADASASIDEEEEEEEEEGKKSTSADSKNLPFQRIFSEEDDIAILNGMIEFQSKMAADPFKNVGAFCDFVKKSLNVEPTSRQLKHKIIRLKKKFDANVGKGNNGQAPSFVKSYDREAFELSKKIWGNVANGKAVKRTPKKEEGGGGGRAKVQKQEVKLLADSIEDDDSDDSSEEEEEEEGLKMDIDEIESIDYGVGWNGLYEGVMKRGLELIGASEKKKFETRYKELQAAEFEAAVRRLELTAKQARLAYEAIKSSNH